MGGHRVPMREDADLTLPGMANIVGDLLDALDLADFTLVVTDWGGHCSSPTSAATNALHDW